MKKLLPLVKDDFAKNGIAILVVVGPDDAALPALSRPLSVKYLHIFSGPAASSTSSDFIS